MTRSRETGDVGYRAYKKNLLRNGDFSVNQRNWSGSIPASGTRTLDGVVGYLNVAAGDGLSFIQLASTAGDVAITNQPYAMQVDFVTSDPVASQTLFGQHIEDGVQITAGKDVSMSFTVFSGVEREISIEYLQYFGAGGSTTVRGITKKISLVVGWQDVEVTTFIPAVTGKTFGTDSFLQCLIWLSAGSNDVINSAALGLQPDGFVVMASWQVEIASSATEFEYVSPAENLAACQRYFERINYAAASSIAFGQAYTTTTASGQVYYTAKRIAPTAGNITISGSAAVLGPSGGNAGGTLTFAGSRSATSVSIEVTGANGTLVAGNAATFYALAAVNIDVDAEL